MPLKKSSFFEYKPAKGLDLDQKVTQFSLMCPGIAKNTVFHGLNLLGSSEFKPCRPSAVKVEYSPDSRRTDIEVEDEEVEDRRLGKISSFYLHRISYHF